jgi:hypothetical protein
MIQGFDSDSPPDADTGTAAEPARTAASAEPKPPEAELWWLLPALLLTGFGALIWQVKTHGPVVILDVHIRDRLQDAAHSPSMAWFFHPGRAMADLGDPSVSVPALLVVTALAIRAARSWRPALLTAAASAALASVIPLKLWIARPGPSAATHSDATLGFFPSGHTADAILCYGTSALLLCAFVIPDDPHARSLRQATIAAACVLVAATIFGLLWSDFHWLSDAAGSLCWCGAALAVLNRAAR